MIKMRIHKWSAAAIILAAMIAAGLSWRMGNTSWTPVAIQSYIASCGIWGPIVYILLYTFRPLILFPAIILTLAGGLAFGPLWGTCLVVLGGTLGACLCFIVARILGREKINQIWGHYSWWEKWNNSSVTYGFRTVLIMRIVPIFPYDPVSFLAGLANIRFRDYALATAIGIVPGALAYNMIGYMLTDVFSIWFYLAVLFTIIIFLVPLYYYMISCNDLVEYEFLKGFRKRL